MHCEKQIADGVYWVGGDDTRLERFESLHPVPDGMSYNNYLILDEKTVLMDTIDRSVEERFVNTVEHLLDGRALDYIVVQHMEPDHSASLGRVAALHPEAKLICTKTCAKIIGQFFGEAVAARTVCVGSGDTLDLGVRTLTFVAAPMVHWPDVMVTYDAHDKLLFSADAFGSFGASRGRLFDDEYELAELVDEMRRYYVNIVGKYGVQVNALLDAYETLDVDLVCPLHGRMLRGYKSEVAALYRAWASYEPEGRAVAIAYASVYGNTADVAQKLAIKLAERGVADCTTIDLASMDTSYALAECFRVSNIVLASVTFNAGLHPRMEQLIADMQAHNLHDRRYSIIQNGSWAPAAARLMQKGLDAMPGTAYVGDVFTVKSRMADAQEDGLDALADAIAADVLATGEGAASEAASADAAAAADSAKGEEAMETWRCTVCGYEVQMPKGSDMSSYTCPLCGRVGTFKLVGD